jgi:hypothetical protein
MKLSRLSQEGQSARNGLGTMTARIFRPAKSAMQSGLRTTREWILEFEPESPPVIEPLMGWTASGDTRTQVRISFDTKEEAVAFAERNHIAYRIEDPLPVTRKQISYADNFKFNRIGQWTH